MKKFDNFQSNLEVLLRARDEDLDNEFISSGIINKFFVQFELGWKVLKELLKFEGRSESNTGSPREIIKAAYSVYDFIDEDVWLSMLSARNNMAYIYDGNAAQELVKHIISEYVPEFVKMRDRIIEKYKGENI